MFLCSVNSVFKKLLSLFLLNAWLGFPCRAPITEGKGSPFFFSVPGFGNAMRTARFFSVREGKSKMLIVKRWQCSKTPASKHPAG